MTEYADLGLIRTLKFNPPTDDEVGDVLHGIINKETGD